MHLLYIVCTGAVLGRRVFKCRNRHDPRDPATPMMSPASAAAPVITPAASLVSPASAAAPVITPAVPLVSPRQASTPNAAPANQQRNAASQWPAATTNQQPAAPAARGYAVPPTQRTVPAVSYNGTSTPLPVGAGYIVTPNMLTLANRTSPLAPFAQPVGDLRTGWIRLPNYPGDPNNPSIPPPAPPLLDQQIDVNNMPSNDLEIVNYYCDYPLGLIRGLTVTLPSVPTQDDMDAYFISAANQIRRISGLPPFTLDACLSLHALGAALTGLAGHGGFGALPGNMTDCGTFNAAEGLGDIYIVYPMWQRIQVNLWYFLFNSVGSWRMDIVDRSLTKHLRKLDMGSSLLTEM